MKTLIVVMTMNLPALSLGVSRVAGGAAASVVGYHAAATALNYFAYNFIKIHRTLRVSPGTAAGVTDRLWT